MRFCLLTASFLAAVSFLAVPLDAQEIRSPYRFLDETHGAGLFVGYFIGDPGEPAVGPHSSLIFGARYGTRLTGPLSVEFGAAYAPAEREVIAFDTIAGQIDPTGQMVGMNLLLLEVGIRFHLTGPRTWNGFAPYVLAGTGMSSNLTGVTAADVQLPEDQRFRLGQSIIANLGVGTDIYVAERLSLRLEARDHILRMRVPAGLSRTQQSEAIWTNNFALTLGAAFHF